MVLPRTHPRKLAAIALGLGVLASGCGGSSHPPVGTKRVAGDGFRFHAPADWKVRHLVRSVEARQGDALVSVTTFPLPRAFRPAEWAKAVPELDRVAGEVAAREGAKLTSSQTRRIAGLQGRVYVLDHHGTEERIGFVLAGRREYELFCRDAGGACNTLFASFSLGA